MTAGGTMLAAEVQASAGTARGVPACAGGVPPGAGAGLPNGARVGFPDGEYVVTPQGLQKVTDGYR